VPRRLTFAVPLFGLCLLLLSSNAFAQWGDYWGEDYELNVFGAFSMYTKASYTIGFPQLNVPTPGQVTFDNKVRYGARLGVYTRGHWGQEFFYSYEPNVFSIAQRGQPTDNLHLNIHNYGINALYYLVESETHTVQPFLSAGIGGTYYQLTEESLLFLRDPNGGNRPDMNNTNLLAFNFGFGFKTRSNGHFGVRMDVRDFITPNPRFGLVRSSNNPAAEVLPTTGALNNGEFSAGVVFYFQKRQ
jgi:Outer membrane protein beta-barrel domain